MLCSNCLRQTRVWLAEQPSNVVVVVCCREADLILRLVFPSVVIDQNHEAPEGLVQIRRKWHGIFG